MLDHKTGKTNKLRRYYLSFQYNIKIQLDRLKLSRATKLGEIHVSVRRTTLENKKGFIFVLFRYIELIRDSE